MHPNPLPLAHAGQFAAGHGHAQLATTLRYDAVGAALDVLRDVGALATVDQAVERQIRGAGRWLGLCALALGLCFLGGFFFPPVWALCAPALVGVVVFAIRRSRFAKADLVNRRYQLLGRVTTLLGTDLSPQAPVVARVGLGALERDGNIRNQFEQGRVKTTIYAEPWFILEGRFADATKFRFQLEEQLIIRRVRKTNPRGKTKTKYKRKASLSATLSLTPKTDRFPGLSRVAGGARTATQLPPGVVAKNVVVANNALTLKVSSKSDWYVRQPGSPPTHGQVDAVELTALMFLSLYQVLNLAKRVSAKAA